MRFGTERRLGLGRGGIWRRGAEEVGGNEEDASANYEESVSKFLSANMWVEWVHVYMYKYTTSWFDFLFCFRF